MGWNFDCVSSCRIFISIVVSTFISRCPGANYTIYGILIQFINTQPFYHYIICWFKLSKYLSINKYRYLNTLLRNNCKDNSL